MERDKLLTVAIAGTLVAGIIPIGILIYTTQLINQQEGYIFTDSFGREVIIPYQPNRIISLSPSITETLYALNVEDRVKGVSTKCNYPLNASDKPKVGEYTTPNLELITALNPDLIISASDLWTAEKIATIESLGFSFIIITAYTVNDGIDNIGKIANLTNTNSKGIELMNSLITDLEAITNETEDLTPAQLKSVYFEVYSIMDPGGDITKDQLMAVGPLNHLGNMIKMAGGTNIFESKTQSRYVYTNHEPVIDENPEFIFVVLMGRTDYDFKVDFEERKNLKGYDSVSACKNNDVYLLDDDIFCRLGPRIVQGLENMTRYLHPGLLP